MDAQIPIVVSKLSPPRRAGGLVPRARLAELLNSGGQSKLRLILAPAGYGKSTLMAEQFRELRAGGACVAWVSLEYDDRDPVRFLTYFVAGLKRAGSDLVAGTHALLGAGTGVPARGVLLTLLNEIGACAQPVTVMLDDYYRAECTELNEILDRLLDHAPDNLRLVIASRVVPNLKIGALRAQGQLSEIHAPALRFELDETTSFFNDVHELGLTAAQVAALHERMDGWVTGLQLASISLRDRSDRDSFISEFSGSHRDIVDYLATDVLDRQSSETKTFLQQTSILERLTAPLCTAVTQLDNSQEIIERLEHDNLFLLSLDDGREWYRYHHVFSEFLLRNFEREQPGKVEELHRRAYQWFADQGMLPEAVGHAIAAEDWSRTADFIESCWYDTVKMGRILTLYGWIGRLPPEILAGRPLVQLAYSWALALMRRCEGARTMFEAARTKIQEAGVDTSRVGSNRRQALALELQTTQALIAVFEDDIDRIREVVQTPVHEVSDPDPFIRGVHDNLLVFSNQTVGRFDAARRAAAHGRALHIRADSVYGMIYSDFFLGLVDVTEGDLGAAESHALRAFGLAKERIGQHSDPAALPASLLATIYYEWDRIEEARKYLDLSLPLIDECAALDAVIHGYRTLARMQYLENAPSDALDTLAVAEAIGDRGNFPRLTVSILGQRVHFLIRMGDVESASNVVEEMLGLAARAERRRVDLWPRLHSVADMAKARLQIATGAPEKGLRLLRDYAAMAEAAGRRQVLVEIRLLEALADFRLGNNGAAIRRLSRALSEGRKGALIRTFVDEGGELARLFRVALDEWSGSRISGAARPDPEYLSQLEAAMEIGAEAVARAGAPCAGIDLDRLSGRETDVLRLVAEGTTNKGIAAELGVAESTVAWHLKNIYGKLDVSNRTAALAVARRHAFIA